MDAVQAVRTMISVIASGAGRYGRPTADLACERVCARVCSKVALIIFSFHDFCQFFHFFNRKGRTGQRNRCNGQCFDRTVIRREGSSPKFAAPVLYDLLRFGGVDLVLNDQRRAFSEEYVNFELLKCGCYVELSTHNPLSEQSQVELGELKRLPCTDE